MDWTTDPKEEVSGKLSGDPLRGQPALALRAEPASGLVGSRFDQAQEARDIIAEHEGLGMPKGVRADQIISALEQAGFNIVGPANIEAAAQEMAVLAKVGPWDKMHDDPPLGWGSMASRNYWRKMASAALRAKATGAA